jgi:hypothetical protein
MPSHSTPLTIRSPSWPPYTVVNLQAGKQTYRQTDQTDRHTDRQYTRTPQFKRNAPKPQAAAGRGRRCTVFVCVRQRQRETAQQLALPNSSVSTAVGTGRLAVQAVQAPQHSTQTGCGSPVWRTKFKPIQPPAVHSQTHPHTLHTSHLTRHPGTDLLSPTPAQ